MAKKYIELEAAINKIMGNIVHQDSHDANLHNIGLRKAMSAIDILPAVDVVEVVRCGQCKYWKQKENREYGLCAKHRGIWLNSDFCSKGERKNGGQDE